MLQSLNPPMLEKIKSLDDKIGSVLIAFCRAVAGISFYISIFYLLATLAIETNETFANWLASKILNEHGETNPLIGFVGLGLFILSALLYLFIPIRHFGILLSPLIIAFCLPLFIILFL